MERPPSLFGEAPRATRAKTIELPRTSLSEEAEEASTELERRIELRLRTRSNAHEAEDEVLPSETFSMLNKPKGSLGGYASPTKRRSVAGFGPPGSPTRRNAAFTRQGSGWDLPAAVDAVGAARGQGVGNAGTIERQGHRKSVDLSLRGVARHAAAQPQGSSRKQMGRDHLARAQTRPLPLGAVQARTEAGAALVEHHSSDLGPTRSTCAPDAPQPLGQTSHGGIECGRQAQEGQQAQEAKPLRGPRRANAAFVGALDHFLTTWHGGGSQHAGAAQRYRRSPHERASGGSGGRATESRTEVEDGERARAEAEAGNHADVQPFTDERSVRRSAQPARAAQPLELAEYDARDDSEEHAKAETALGDRSAQAGAAAAAAAAARGALEDSALPASGAAADAAAYDKRLLRSASTISQVAYHTARARTLLRTVLGGGYSDDSEDADEEEPWFVRFAVHPSSPAVLRWRWLVFWCAVYVAFEAPYSAAFLYETPAELAALAALVDFVLFADVLAKLLIGFVSEDANQVVLDIRQIAARYARSWLALDAIVGVPWQLVGLVVSAAGGAEYGTFVRGARVTECLKMPVVLVARRHADPSNGALVTSLMLCYFIALSWFTCIQWALPRLLDYPPESWVRTTGLVEFDAAGQWLNTAFNTISQSAR